MTIPTIHLNGTSGEELLAGYTAALVALHNAAKALTVTAPHGRDYYVQSPAAIGLAQAEHVARAERLAALIEEVTVLAVAVLDQNAQRASDYRV